MMVMDFDAKRLLLVLQVDHSHVAGFLGAHWGNTQFARPEPFTSVVLAGQEHDGGWADWEMKPFTLNDQGYPLDYHDGSLKYLKKRRLDFYSKAVNRVARQDPYAALLILMHGVGLMNSHYGRVKYPPPRTSDPLVKEYVDDQERLRQKLLDQLRQSKEFEQFSTDERIWVNLDTMETFDKIAQFVCNRYPLNSTSRKNGPSNSLNDVLVPVAPGVAHVKMEVDPIAENRAVIRPYPFDVDPIAVSFPARLVAKRVYKDPNDFLSEFYKAERITITHTLASA
jgi:hypothetical protein